MKIVRSLLLAVAIFIGTSQVSAHFFQAQLLENCDDASLQGSNNAQSCIEKGCYYDEKAALAGEASCFPTIIGCEDTIDESNHPFVKGEAWGYKKDKYNGRGRIQAVDTCDGDILQEVGCGADQFITYTNLGCAFGCHDGLCKLEDEDSICIDSDGGNDIYTKGEVKTDTGNTAGVETFEDACVTRLSLDMYIFAEGNSCHGGTCYMQEMICNKDGKIEDPKHYCPYGCEDGVCKKEPVKQTCTDSDGGDNPNVYGEVEAYIGRTTTGELGHVIAKDRCVNSKVTEHFCVDVGHLGSNFSVESRHCEYGCENGACLPEPKEKPKRSCIDTDEGDNPYVYGEIEAWVPNTIGGLDFLYFKDTCVGSMVAEHYCTKDALGGITAGSFRHNCPHGCADGKCKKADSKPNPPICPLAMCASPKPDCTYIKDTTLNSNGCPKYPCGRYECETTQDSDSDTSPDVEYEDEVIVNTAEEVFTDVNQSTDVGRAAAHLHNKGIIGGYPDGEFKGDRPVNRAEVAKFLMLATYGEVPTDYDEIPFWDAKRGEWYVKYIVFAALKNVLSGHPDGSFKPADTVNTAEFLKMVTLAFDLPMHLPHQYTDVPDDAWYSPYAGVAWVYNLFPNRHLQLEPSRLLTRAEVAIALEKILNR